jgi:NAD(P)-dependent dehydrogenase (short-subunit alcohol dehydrogenase family)
MICTSSARAAVQNLVKTLSFEFAPQVRFNSILLGLIKTNQWESRFEDREDKSINRNDWYQNLALNKGIPLGRLGNPEEVASAIAFLGSSDSSYITGAQLEISGGLSKHI